MMRTILIVDDSVVNRRLLYRILSEEYEVLEAENGKEALAILEERGENISAILLDLVMPVMNGYEMLAILREDETLSQIPVIVTTGSGDVDTEVRVLSLGANDFIIKPYHPAVIRRRLWNTINLRETAAYVNAIQRDRLTGLYNRETFFKKTEEMIAAHEPGHYVMACFNVNNFKLINDQYGNAKGDDVLRMLALIFRAGFEPVGGICCRVTADNFAILYPRDYIDSDLLDGIRRDAARLDGSIRPITFSIGRYIVNDLSLSPSAMFDRATIALASVKARFDVQIAQYDESMRETILREQEVINEMNVALAEGQFEPWLQPQYNHASGALIGAEVLVRWRHPRKGLIPPNIFIPVFERNGFIYEMDKNIWEQACALLRKWLDEGREPLPLSVNVSRYDLFRSDFFQTISGLVLKYAIPIDLFRLEITESAFAKSTERIVSVVKRLVEYGFTVEIDDFGSGYSSFNTLKDVPANILKLDMRFLEDTDNASRSGSILESIVRMAKWLNMPVIAEGVETREQADYLRSIGCFYVQGYLYARPMPAVKYEIDSLHADKERRMATLEKVRTLDNAAFWNPHSLETLIFNSYVGGACIFEFHNGAMELLRVNEKYAMELGGHDMTIEEALQFDLPSNLDEENGAILRANIERAIHTDDESTCEVRMTGPGEARQILWIRTTVRVIARAGTRMLFYCAIANTTAQREAERKESESFEQLLFLNNTAHDLVSQADVNEGIRGVLERLRDYFGANRAYILEMNDDRRMVTNTYEVCATGVQSVLTQFQALSYDAVPYWIETLNNDNYVAIEDVSALDDSRAEERRVLSEHGIRSLIIVPLRKIGRLIGFVGVDEPSRNQGNIARLRAIGDYLSTALNRRDLGTRVENDNRTLLRLMNDTPGGFARMRLAEDGAIQVVYVNDGFCKLVGMSSDDVMRNVRDDVVAVVHPDDLAVVHAADQTMRDTGEVHGVKCRLRHGGGGYVRLRVFGRMTRGAPGETFYNIYFTEVSERENRELTFGETLQIALDAIMASSTELAFIKDKNLTYLCCTTAFANMVGLPDRLAVVGKTDYDLFDRPLAEQYRADDMRLMASRESLVDYTEPLPSEDGAPRYASTSKYLLYDSEGDVIGLYGAGRDITESREAYAQLKLLANTIPGGLAMYQITREGCRPLYFSDGFFTATGYSREEYQALANEDALFLVFPEDRHLIDDQIEALRNGADALDCSYRARSKDGGYSWQMLRGMVLERDGDSLMINTVKFDITQQTLADEKMRIREEEYRLAIAHSGKMVYRYSHADNCIELPEDTAALLKLPTRVENVPDNLIDKGQVDPDSCADYRAFYKAVRRGDKTGCATIRRRLSDGKYHWLTVRFSNIFNDRGKPVSAIIVLEDVTAAREEQIVEALDRSRLMTALRTIYPVSVSVNLTKGTYQAITGGDLLFETLAESGSYDDFISDTGKCVETDFAERFTHALSAERLLRRLVKAGETCSVEYRQLCGDGHVHWLEAVAIRVENDFNDDAIGVMMFRIIDELKTTEDKLKLARIDGMTGLYNKTTTEEMIRQRIARADGSFCALIMADLDSLKSINDTLGHDQGDRAIQMIAKLLRSQFRQTDIVGRVGGDEFVVFMDGGNTARLRSVMIAFMRSLSAVRVGDNRDIPLHGSVGIATGTLGDETYETLFKRADKALYHVKRNGKDDFAFYTPDMEQTAYRYESQGLTSRWRTSDLGGDELDRLLKAVAALYPLVISVNLTQNSYYMMQYENYTTTTCLSAGVFDELVAEGALTFHREDRASFMAAFTRANMLAAHARGETIISHIGRQLGDDGVYRVIRTDAVFVPGDSGDDVRQITVGREIGDVPPFGASPMPDSPG